MVRDKFKYWVEKSKGELENSLITTEFIKYKTLDESLIPDPSTGIIHESKNCFGQVIVWESGQMEYEVLNIRTEEMILWRYFEKVPDEPDFDNILAEYFFVLQSGLKP
ncbi:immunity protein TriTu family protein [Paenibacillus mendelii]|uniref:YopX protein domain-containing protein n=1 Tax=Paenibacillus mendelii TaxID=206163 RepID=A0ABV6JAV5_9BACL|nr:hypothetical protein [Paenibacillus mendelii]MCQ6564117.1 hypothetical protein [Paenibacillus mendelii]